MAGAAAVIAATTVTPACGRIAGTDQTETQAKEASESTAAADLVYELGPGAVPGLDTAKAQRSTLEVEPSIERPTTAVAYDVDGETYVRLDGSSDALEGPMPSGLPAVDVKGEGGRGLGVVGNGRAFLFLADPTIPDDIIEGEVLVIGPPGDVPEGKAPTQEFIDTALAIAGDAPDAVGKELSRGDLSAFLGGTVGTMLSYPAEPYPTLRIYTFPDASLSPVLADMAPLFRAIKVGGRPGYAFGTPGSDMPGSPGTGPSIVFEGPDGGLGMLASPHGFSFDDLRTIASRVRRAAT